MIGISSFNSKHNFIQRPDLKINVTDCDYIFIEIPNRKIIIGLIYKPDYVVYDHYITQLKKTLGTITKERKTGFILGNFNIDLLKYHDNNLVNTSYVLIFILSLY